MWLYNKGQRSFILASGLIFEGGRTIERAGKDGPQCAFDPQAKADIADETARKLLTMYPKDIIEIEKPSTPKRVPDAPEAPRRTRRRR